MKNLFNNNRIRAFIFSIVLAILSFSQTAISKIDDIEDKIPNDFNVERFEEYLHQKLDEDYMGYSYFVGKDQYVLAKGAHGLARSPQDGILPMTTQTRLKLASVTKVFTSIALFKLFEMYPQYNEFTQIKDVIPYRWRKMIENGPYADLNFRTLMEHRSGFLHTSTYSVSEVLQMPPQEPLGARHYANHNMILIGFAMPYMLNPDYMDLLEQEAKELNDEEYEEFISVTARQYYESFLIEHVLEPAGLSKASCMFSNFNPEPAYFYSDPNDPFPGYIVKDSEVSICSAGTLAMDIEELAQFMWAFLNSEEVVNDASKETINLFEKNRYLAWQSFKHLHSAEGGRNYLTHNGLLKYPRDHDSSIDGKVYQEIPLAQAKSGLVLSSEGVYAGILTNSFNEDAQRPEQVLIEAIDYATYQYCSTSNTPSDPLYLDYQIYLQTIKLGNNFSHYSGQSLIHYEDFSQEIVPLSRNQSHNFTWRVVGNFKIDHSAVIAWIDFDQDNFFDADEQVYIEESIGQSDDFHYGMFFIPGDVKLGKTRMRIKTIKVIEDDDMKSNILLDPCFFPSVGETEDYSVEIIE